MTIIHNPRLCYHNLGLWYYCAKAFHSWLLTAQERAAITGAFKEMSGRGQSEKQQTHKEYGKIRKKRDEEDVQTVTKLLLTIVKNPSEVVRISFN